jgi:hypothetical protein
LLKTLPGDVGNDIFEQAELSLVHFHAERALRTDNIGEEQVAAFDHAINPPIRRATVTTGRRLGQRNQMFTNSGQDRPATGYA